MARIRYLLFISLMMSASLLSAQSQPPFQAPQNWQSQLYDDHPLVGQIWRSDGSEFIEATDLYKAISASKYLLLGEKHDNPDHHSLQAAIINSLIRDDLIAAAAFEMMDSDASALLENIAGQTFASPDDLKDYLNWDEEGWDWTFYGPLLESLVDAKLPITAANISNETMGRVYSEETPENIARVLNDETVEKLNIDIDESHCGLLPESQFPAMVRVQQTRDDAMANAMLEPSTGKISLLVAGNYHIRQDLGVSNYLLAKNASLSRDEIVSLAFLEVDPASSDPVEYLQQFAEIAAYDFVWFTPAISDEDYCASLQ